MEMLVSLPLAKLKLFSALALIAALEGVNGSQAQRRGPLDDDLAIGVEDRRRQNA